MTSLRKRHRPLDLGEERSIHADAKMGVDVLEDEQTYCYRWPDAPLSLTLSVGKNISNEPTSSTQSHTTTTKGAPGDPVIALPIVMTVDNYTIYDGPHHHYMDSIIACLRRSAGSLPPPPATSTLTPPSSLGAPTALSTSEDSIFSLTTEQVRQAQDAGLFTTLVAGDGVSNQHATQRKIEEEIVRLEWRAFHEATHTSAALQRLLRLEVAVPFISNNGAPSAGMPDMPEPWRRKVHELWIHWRTAGARDFPHNAECRKEAGNQRWGAPLLPGAYLYGWQQDYFLNTGLTTNSPVAASSGTSSTKTNALFSLDESSTLSYGANARRRRHTPYSFLPWKVENAVMEVLQRSDTGYLASGAARSQRSMMSPEDVDRLVQHILNAKNSLTDVVTLDEEMQDIKCLECCDLQSSVGTWMRWLQQL